MNYGALSYEAIDIIIDLRLKSVSEMVGIKISINKSMRDFLHQNSNTKYGNRLIDSLIRESISRALVDVYTKEITASVIVVTGKNKYRIVKKSYAVKEELRPGA